MSNGLSMDQHGSGQLLGQQGNTRMGSTPMRPNPMGRNASMGACQVHPISWLLIFTRRAAVKTLRRKFPRAEIHETDDAEKAVEIARAVNQAAIIHAPDF
jgi:hypothetical protein